MIHNTSRPDDQHRLLKVNNYHSDEFHMSLYVGVYSPIKIEHDDAFDVFLTGFRGRRRRPTSTCRASSPSNFFVQFPPGRVELFVRHDLQRTAAANTQAQWIALLQVITLIKKKNKI